MTDDPGPDADLRRRADANFSEMFRILARAAAAASGQAAIRERTDGSLIATGVPVPLFNPAFLRSGAAFRDFVADAQGFFGDRRLPWALVVPDHVPAPPPREAGLFVLQTLPVYAHPARPGASWPRLRNAGLEIREGAIGSAVVADHRLLLAAAFGIPEEMSRVVLPDALPSGAHPTATPTSCLRLYVAYRNDEPVGSAALCLAGGVAGIYNVAAHPLCRRQGIATALMRRVLADAQARGLETSILQSSTAGLPLYARLGFQRLATYAIYRGDRR